MNSFNDKTATAPWRYKIAGAFVIYHFCAIALLIVAPNDRLLMLELPVYIVGLLLMISAPEVLDTIIRALPHPSALRGALNPGTVIFSTLIWAALGFAVGIFFERLARMKFPKTKA